MVHVQTPSSSPSRDKWPRQDRAGVSLTKSKYTAPGPLSAQAPGAQVWRPPPKILITTAPPPGSPFLHQVHLFDARSNAFIQSFPGHRDAVTGLAFREGTHQLFSCSLDRTVKMWSIDDRAYMDTLFGHQVGGWGLSNPGFGTGYVTTWIPWATVYMLRQERSVTVGNARNQ